ncbi:hypothetical protein G3O06_20675 [Burkholderia sp. Ac-20345]|uniref:hypothetical protein n=1 Tax=Burkholderia sp. Ac-20345 TaxID=2703891 RepID=UPI00197B67B0|nr:hypothetical protein [Burkholderia sp. Ac-20345]MBN3779955.1 hypothetical protein [Burkholderia sp. Ac-20345]
MHGFVLIRGTFVIPESFRFTSEACKGQTSTWQDDAGRYHAFDFWRRQGWRVQPAFLELVD